MRRKKNLPFSIRILFVGSVLLWILYLFYSYHLLFHSRRPTNFHILPPLTNGTPIIPTTFRSTPINNTPSWNQTSTVPFRNGSHSVVVAQKEILKNIQ